MTHVRHRIRSDAVWSRARDAYLGGQSALAVCERFDLGLSAFRARARRCGWRRLDQPDPDVDDPDAPLAQLDPDDESDAPHPLSSDLRYAGAGDLRRVAWRRVRRAVDGGRALEARRWIGIMERLSTLAGLESAQLRGLVTDDDDDPSA